MAKLVPVPALRACSVYADQKTGGIQAGGPREEQLRATATQSGSPLFVLELLVKFAAGAGNKDSAGGVAFPVFHALYDSGRLAAFRAIGALGGIHDFLAVCRFGNLSHDSIFSWDVGFSAALKSAAANAVGNLRTAHYSSGAS
jgi:hypothetical protein